MQFLHKDMTLVTCVCPPTAPRKLVSLPALLTMVPGIIPPGTIFWTSPPA